MLIMENYKEAALRHLKDSESLYAQKAYDNAGHLIGFAAECAIKHKIELSGDKGDNPKAHFPAIIMAAKKRLTGRKNISISQILSSKIPILNGWDVNARYYNTGTVSKELVAKWIGETKRLFATADIRGRNE